MKKLNDIVDHVYVINLDRRTDRMTECEKEMNKCGITYERFPAVDGNTLQDTANQTKFRLGCTSSHINVINDAIAKDFNTICIFEDDVKLSDNFNAELLPAFYKLPEGWELFYLGANHKERPIEVDSPIYKVSKSLTTHAYVAHKRVFKILLDILVKNKENMIVDVLLTKIQQRGNSYTIKPNIAYQKEGFSDIEQSFRNYDVWLKN